VHYKKNEKLSRLIENKRVVLVGPAQYLVGKKLGPIINGFDTVCRVNYMAPCEFTSDYGNRTDIMFYNCAALSLKQMKQHLKEYPDFGKKMKLVVCPVVKSLGPDKWEEWEDDYVSKVVSNFDSINVYNNDFHWIGIKNYKYLFSLINRKEPNTGPLSMSIILEHNPKELFITGFTFYIDKEMAYFNGYATQVPNWKGIPGHAQKHQIEFFKSNILSKGVKIDSYLKTLLKLQYNNIKEL
jgi:hypothetical protein